LVADKGKPELTYIAIIPSFLFYVLDSYYLAMEKGFRLSYNEFVEKLHNNRLTPVDLYSIESSGCISYFQLKALLSFSTWCFYVMLIFLILVTKYLIVT